MVPVEIRRAASAYADNIKHADDKRLAIISAFIAGAEFATARHSTDVRIEPPLFQNVWELYDRKDAKQNAIKAWGKLTDREKQKALQHIPAFVKAHPDKKYRPMLATYLNQKRFLDDEIISNSINNEQQQRLSAYADAIAGFNTDR